MNIDKINAALDMQSEIIDMCKQLIIENQKLQKQIEDMKSDKCPNCESIKQRGDWGCDFCGWEI